MGADAQVHVPAAVVDGEVAVEHRQVGRPAQTELVGGAVDERPEADLVPPRALEHRRQQRLQDVLVRLDGEHLDIAESRLVVAIGRGAAAGTVEVGRA